MTDFLLVFAFVMTLLCGYWIMYQFDRFLDSVKAENDDTDAQ